MSSHQRRGVCRSRAVAAKWVNLVVGVAFFSLPGLALSAGASDEFEEEPWVESAVQLPAFPEKENLIPFQVGPVSDKQFLIDEKSISVGDDGVIRYTLVVVSDAGARSISFEGMRCTTRERRLYAFGRADSTWSKARSDKWIAIRGSSSQYPVALYADYLCAAEASVIYSPAEVVRRLRYGR